MEKLIKIQGKLKVPKGQTNAFGGYKYRSCEDILEAVKPLCVAEGVQLVLTDEIVAVGDRYYVKATATIADGETVLAVVAYAREALTKKGQDESQITGSASSYARKYALNGLFLIDDTKDADTQDNSVKEVAFITQKQMSELVDLITDSGADGTKFCEFLGVDSLANLPVKDFNKAKTALLAKKAKVKE
jgi:hypothetical protein